MTASPYSPSPNGGYVSNELLALKIEHLSTTVDTLATNVMGELRLLRTETIRRDVYEEQRRADQAELKSLRDQLAQRIDKSDLAAHTADLAAIKEELKEKKTRGWAVWLALAAASFTLLKDLAVGILQ